jgi:hypothetical protein
MTEQRHPNPKDAFRNFLEKAENDAWIASYKWTSGETFGELKKKLKYPCPSEISRTHKKGSDGFWWALEVEAHEGTQVGVDLEIFMSRPILTRPKWITERLNLPESTQPQKILEEWSSREAAFKSFRPDNDKMLLSQFKRGAHGAYTVFGSFGEKPCQVRNAWAGKWVLSLAWRSHR